jgi:hypothetical protein
MEEGWQLTPPAAAEQWSLLFAADADNVVSRARASAASAGAWSRPSRWPVAPALLLVRSWTCWALRRLALLSSRSTHARQCDMHARVEDASSSSYLC